MKTVKLRAGHVQPVWAGHPWVYAQAVESVDGALAGEAVTVVDPRGNALGTGFYSPQSAIAVRIFSRQAGALFNAELVRSRVAAAIDLRARLRLPSAETTGYRLVNAEGDGFPGLIVDRFGDALVVQLLSIGTKVNQEMIFDALEELTGAQTIVDRTPPAMAKLERFEPGSGVVRGKATDAFEFRERGFDYRLPTELAQKTGFYFDQRALRGRVEELAGGLRVLDAYSFVGPFSLAAARGGARSVSAVDNSSVAMTVGEACAQANGFGDRITFEKNDARVALENAAKAGGFDLVIVDPPRLAPTRTSRDKALGAYSKVAQAGCAATANGGLLVYCSCSAAIDLGTLNRTLASGALQANKHATVIERHFQAGDHPVSAAFPEGLYLKAIIARIDAR